MNSVVFKDDQTAITAGNTVGQQVVRVDFALDQVAAAAPALVKLDQRLDVASLVKGHIPHLEGEKQRLVERDAIFLDGQFRARSFLTVSGIDGHVAAMRKHKCIADRSGLREVVDAPAPGDRKGIQCIETHAMELRGHLVDRRINVPGQIVQRQVLLRVADFHVEVRTGRGTGIAHLTDNIALLHGELVRAEFQIDAETLTRVLFLLHPPGHRLAEAEQMPVNRSRTVGMRHVDAVAIAPGRDAHPGDVSTLDDVDIIADLSTHAPVKAAVEMVVPQLAIGAGKRHGHFERPDGLLLCPGAHSEKERDDPD